MRVKRYKRVKRQKIHLEPSLSTSGEEDRYQASSQALVSARPEDSDQNINDANNIATDEHDNALQANLPRHLEKSFRERMCKDEAHHEDTCPHSIASESRTTIKIANAECVTDVASPSASIDSGGGDLGSTLVWPKGTRTINEAAFSSVLTKNQNQASSDEGAMRREESPGAGVLARERNSIEEADEENKLILTPTGGIVWSDVIDVTSSGIRLHPDGKGDVEARGTPSTTPSAVEWKQSGIHVEDDNISHNDHSNEDGDKIVPWEGGTLWFKAERVAIFLQLLALTIDMDGSEWPPLFSRMWGWVWLTTAYMRWPVSILLRRVGRGFSLSFGEEQLDLWFFRDVVGYGVEICAATVGAFVLFFVLQMPDYTSRTPKEAWKLSFLTHWLRRTFPSYLLKLCLSYGVFFGLTFYGAYFLPAEVITAVVVVGGTLLTLSWLFVVLLSFSVHVKVRLATKHDAEYSFMIAMKHIVRIKCRSCLFFLHLAYVPITASIVRALLPVFDWNDTWAPASRREFNHHVWCFFSGFPPQVKGTEELIVLECTSVSGVAVHTLSACFFLLFVSGLPNMVRYLIRLLSVAFESNADVIRSFLQAREVHNTALDAIKSFPKDAVWLARRRREIVLAWLAIDRFRRRVWRIAIASLRRVPFVCRLPCTRPGRRKKAMVAAAGVDESNSTDVDISVGDGINVDAFVLSGCDDSHVDGGDVDHRVRDANPPNESPLTVDTIAPKNSFAGDVNVYATQGFSSIRGGPSALAVGTVGATLKTSTITDNYVIQGRGAGEGKGRLKVAYHGRIVEYWERRKKACLGLRQALQAEREAYYNARDEFVLAVTDFEADHSLEITCWESVVDTSGLVYLLESYNWQRSGWKVVESVERCVFVSVLLASQQLGPASTRLICGALVLAVFQAWTCKAEPFLHTTEAFLDAGLRLVLILLQCVGAAVASGFVGATVADTLLFAIGAASILTALAWGDAIGAVVALVGQTLSIADERVTDLLFRQVRQRSMGQELSHTGLRLLMQWDDLLEQQRWSAFLAWPTPSPSNILSKKEKMFVVRWAALRGLDIHRTRTSTGLSLLHDSIVNAEVEPARWLVYLYPMLLDAETLHKESPLFLGVLEAARVLLRMEALTARLEDWGLDNAESASQAGTGWGAAGLIERISGGRDKGAGGATEDKGECTSGDNGLISGIPVDKGRLADENELAEMSWKIGRLMEILLSSETQNARVRWNFHQYDLLTEHGQPEMSELAQNLAEAFNLGPPKGYTAVHRWRRRAKFTRDYLGEATCASRTAVDLAGCGLGDGGYRSLLSVCRALSIPSTSVTWPNVCTMQFRINVVRLDLSGNRMRRKSGYRIADMLLLNKTIADLNVSNNCLDSDAASEIFYSARKNEVLKKLDISCNKVGPEVSDSLAGMVMKNRCLTYLDLSGNRMGENKFWKSLTEFAHVPSAGPLLGSSLRNNKTLLVLKVKGNLLGAGTGQAFAEGVRAITSPAYAAADIGRHRSLTTLDLSGNNILPDGGKALALALNFPARSSLTSLDVSDNHLGTKAGKLFSATLKKNRTLVHLDLSRNELGTAAGIAFTTSLRVNRSLESLVSSSNLMGSNVCKNFARSLASNDSLKHADFSGNMFGRITVEGGDPSDLGLLMGHGLGSNTALTSLNLSGNRLPALEIERIAAGLSEHPSLSSLTLSGETVNDSAARDIGRLAAPGRLLSLDLARSALEGVGAVSVARALNTASGLTYLDLSDNVLGVAAAREIANALQNGTGFGVRLLRLVRCGLGPVGGAVVATALGRNRSVEELDLSDNGLGEAAGMALSRSLRVLYRNGEAVRPCRMRRLDVSRNPLGTGAGVAIVGALVNECTQHLDLSHTDLRGGQAGVAVGRMLRCHTIVLRHLNLEHNALGRDGINEVFWALRRNASLLHLDLSDNSAGPILGTEADKLEEYGTTSIHSALSLNQTLRHLDLGTNGLSAECGTTLTASIRRNRSLANVSLENNFLDDQAASTVARKLRRDKQLEYLNLNNNQIGWRGGLDLAAALTLNKHLTHFDIGKNMLGEAGTFAGVGAKFGDALVHNKVLTCLNLEGNKLGPSGGVAIANALRRNNSLVDLNLEDNRFDQDVGFALEDLLKVNFTLNKVGASVGEIGIDSRAVIDDTLAAREKLLETHGDPGEDAATTAAAVSIQDNRNSSSGYASDSSSKTSRARPKSSARALKVRQAAAMRKGSTVSSSMGRR